MALEKVANGLLPFKKKLQSRFNSYSQSKDGTYIIPTPFGLIFGTLVLVLLMMALGYSNNLLYIFVFFLISVSISGMIITNRNIDRLKILSCTGNRCFASEETYLQVKIQSKKAPPSFSVEIKNREFRTSISSILGFEEKIIELAWIPKGRGMQELPRVQMQSQYPFGILRSWKVFKKGDAVLVYPAKNGQLPFPWAEASSGQSGENGLFRDLRLFEATDSLRRIDWRASAKHQELLVKNFESQMQKACHFDWRQTKKLVGIEERISQLSTWIVQAEKMGFRYSLEVGSFYCAVGQGPSHSAKCLEYLALLKRENLD